MAVAFDAASTLVMNFIGGTTGSWTHTPVGTPTSVAVLLNNQVAHAVTGVTYGGFALTLDVASGVVGGSPNRNEIWGSDGVTLPTGPQTVVVTFASVNATCAGAAVTVTGSDPVTCFSNTASNTNGFTTTISVAVTSAVGELVIDMAANTSNDTTLAPTGGTQTSRFSVSPAFAAGSSAPGAASVTMSWSGAAGQALAQAAASFKAASGGGSPVGRGTFAMMGVG